MRTKIDLTGDWTAFIIGVCLIGVSNLAVVLPPPRTPAPAPAPAPASAPRQVVQKAPAQTKRQERPQPADVTAEKPLKAPTEITAESVRAWAEKTKPWPIAAPWNFCINQIRPYEECKAIEVELGGRFDPTDVRVLCANQDAKRPWEKCRNLR